MNRKEKQFSLEKKHAFWHQKINEGERERDCIGWQQSVFIFLSVLVHFNIWNKTKDKPNKNKIQVI